MRSVPLIALVLFASFACSSKKSSSKEGQQSITSANPAEGQATQSATDPNTPCAKALETMRSCEEAFLLQARRVMYERTFDPAESLQKTEGIAERLAKGGLCEEAKQGEVDKAIACMSDDCKAYAECVIGPTMDVVTAQTPTLSCPQETTETVVTRQLDGQTMRLLLCLRKDGIPHGPVMSELPNLTIAGQFENGNAVGKWSKNNLKDGTIEYVKVDERGKVVGPWEE